MLLRYQTLARDVRGEPEVIEKKSRFLASGAPVFSEEEAQQFLFDVKKANHGANHNVFAYRLEGSTVLERQSDDGEPSGTAGMPILDVLRGAQIINAIVVVTRYFGGTLLGTGGLVRAYGKCAKEGLRHAGIIEKVLYQEISIIVPYTLSGKMQYEISQREKHILDTVYGQDVEFQVLVEKPDTNRFVKDVADISSGQAVVAFKEDIYGAFYGEKDLRLFSR